jgi:hypothetical protein
VAAAFRGAAANGPCNELARDTILRIAPGKGDHTVVHVSRRISGFVRTPRRHVRSAKGRQLAIALLAFWLCAGCVGSAVASPPARTATPVVSGPGSTAPVASPAGFLVRALGTPPQITLNIQIRETTRKNHLYGLLELASVNEPVVWCAYQEIYTVACSRSMFPRKDAASDEHEAFRGAVVNAMAGVGYDLLDIKLVGYNGTGWFYFERHRR